MQLLGGREGMGEPAHDDEGSGGGGYARQAPQQQRSAPPAAAPRQAPAQARPASGFDDMDDDIPF
jgi:single-strand DNA-binding protein